MASLLRLPLFELHREKEDEPPRLRPRPPLPREQAQAALSALIGLHDQALREPLPFLPRSGYAFHAAADPARGLRDAALKWCGDDRTRAESGPATQLALRGRDPFADGDAPGRERFGRIADAVFAAVEHGTPFALEDLQ